VLLDIKTIKTIVGYKHRPQYRPRKNQRSQWEVAVERPVYDLTIFKLHCGRLTLKIYTKGERVLRIEAVAHDARELRCGRVLENFARIVAALKSILQRFMDALSCIDQCFIADDLLERLPAAAQVGKTKVGGIDLNQPHAPGRRRLTRWLHRLRTGGSGPGGPSVNTANPSTVPAVPPMI
jgi:hypothetical protein